jgi:hypothetical protein
VEQEVDRMLQGQKQRLTAKWCRDEECWPADDVEWSVDTKKILEIDPKSGSWTDVKAKGVGIGYLSATRGRKGVSPTIFVYPQPGASNPPAVVTPRRVEVAYPNEIVLELGQHAVVTGWRCSTRDKQQLGADAVPGSADDKCRTRPIADVTGFQNSGLGLLGMVGPSAVLVAKEHNGLDYALVPDPVRLTFADRLKEEGRVREMAVGTSHVYVREAEWKGALLGDLDGDGQVDAADAELLANELAEHGPSIKAKASEYRQGLDLNLDRRIDETDQAVLELLIGSHAGEIVPHRLVWYPERLYERGEPLGGSPEPTPVPTTTPTQ